MDGTDQSIEEFLAHFGVKGMKWGIRKDPEKAARKEAGKIQKLDSKFERLAESPDLHMRLWGHSVVTLKKSGDLKKINDKPEYAASKWRLRLGVAKRDLQHKYEDEVASKLLEHIRKNARELVNRSATRRMDIIELERVGKVQRASQNVWKITTVDIKHAADVLNIRIVRDEVGRIVDMIPEGPALEQSFGGEDLAHFGIKGMKWGVRKQRPVSSDSTAKQEVKTRVKKDRIAAVSNNDLQTAIRRMQLEQDFKRLEVNERSAITRWLSSMMLEIGKKEVQRQVGRALLGAAAKKAATGGLA